MYNMPQEFGGKFGAECLNTRLPLPTLLHAGYSVKLKTRRNIINRNVNVHLYSL